MSYFHVKLIWNVNLKGYSSKKWKITNAFWSY